MQHATATSLAANMRDQCLGIRLARLHRVVARHYDRAMRPLGLSLPQLEILGVLMIRGAVRPFELAGSLAVDRSTINRNVTLMERNGWVATETAPSGRTKTVSIAANGIELLASADAAWTEAQAHMSESLGAEAARTLETWLMSLAVLEQ